MTSASRGVQIRCRIGGTSKRLGSWEGKTVATLPWLPSAYTAVPVWGIPHYLSPCPLAKRRTISHGCHAAAGPLLSALVRDTPTVCMVILMATTTYLLVVVMHAQTGLVSWPPARAARPSSGRFCARQTLSKSPNKHLQCAGHCAWYRGVRRARLQPRSGVVLLVILLPRQTSGRRLADVWRTSGGRLSVR